VASTKTRLDHDNSAVWINANRGCLRGTEGLSTWIRVDQPMAAASPTELDCPGRSLRQTRSTASGLSRDPSFSVPLLLDGGDAPDISCRFSTSPVTWPIQGPQDWARPGMSKMTWLPDYSGPTCLVEITFPTSLVPWSGRPRVPSAVGWRETALGTLTRGGDRLRPLTRLGSSALSSTPRSGRCQPIRPELAGFSVAPGVLIQRGFTESTVHDCPEEDDGEDWAWTLAA
jgi:hypothetical protein